MDDFLDRIQFARYNRSHCIVFLLLSYVVDLNKNDLNPKVINLSKYEEKTSSDTFLLTVHYYSVPKLLLL